MCGHIGYIVVGYSSFSFVFICMSYVLIVFLFNIKLLVSTMSEDEEETVELFFPL